MVNTNGAGDTVTAGLLYSISQGWTPFAAGRFATYLAALKIQSLELQFALEGYVKESPGET